MCLRIVTTDRRTRSQTRWYGREAAGMNRTSVGGGVGMLASSPRPHQQHQPWPGHHSSPGVCGQYTTTTTPCDPLHPRLTWQIRSQSGHVHFPLPLPSSIHFSRSLSFIFLLVFLLLFILSSPPFTEKQVLCVLLISYIFFSSSHYHGELGTTETMSISQFYLCLTILGSSASEVTCTLSSPLREDEK